MRKPFFLLDGRRIIFTAKEGWVVTWFGLLNSDTDGKHGTIIIIILRTRTLLIIFKTRFLFFFVLFSFILE